MKKGFTLIELLAVIIVLAAIVIIVVPAVTSIINNSERSTMEASIELYGRAVEQAALEYELVTGITAISYEDIKDYIKHKGNKVECDTFSVEGSNVYLSDCSVDGELVEDYEYSEIDTCALLSGKPNEIGSKYLCKVNEKEKYNFYVVSHELDETTNLIMDRNICEDGTIATSSKTCLVAWNSSRTTSDGPITAMNYLYKATKDWDNISNIIMNYEDENVHHNTQEKGTNGYGDISTIENITTITTTTGTATATYSNLKARMPRYDEVHGDNKCLTYEENGEMGDSCPLWLSNYLNGSLGLQKIEGILGYWTLSSDAYNDNDARNALYVYGSGYVHFSNVGISNHLGVRPVINVKL